jgi:hypothetical protein
MSYASTQTQNQGQTTFCFVFENRGLSLISFVEPDL